LKGLLVAFGGILCCAFVAESEEPTPAVVKTDHVVVQQHSAGDRWASSDGPAPYELSVSELVSAVGDSSDGGQVGPPQYCYDAYLRCITGCDQTFMFGSFFGQFGSPFSFFLSSGCYAGCAIGLASCG